MINLKKKKLRFFGIINSPLQLYTVSLYCNCQVWRKENYGEHIHPFPVLIKTLRPHHVGIVIVLLRYCGVENCVKEKIFWSILTQASFVKSVCCFYKRVALVYTVFVIVECRGMLRRRFLRGSRQPRGKAAAC